jgi:uncharacterized protein DUF5670
MHARSACALEHRWIGADVLRSAFGEEIAMLSTLVIVLVVLWLLGVVTAYTMGGLIHILLVIAIVVVLLRVIQGRNPLAG